MLFGAFVLWASAPNVYGQSSPEDKRGAKDDGEKEQRRDPPSINPYGTGLGAQVMLTNSGFWLGGYYQRTLTATTSFLAEFSLGAGKDGREAAFFDGFGRKDIPNKANYLLIVPFQFGIHQRLFKESIEDNFRPFLQFTAGPTIGWESPYFDDKNGNGSFDEGERTYDSFTSLPRGHLSPAVSGMIGFGAQFGRSKKFTQAVRIGYTFIYFFEGIQLLEADVQRADHIFGTPSISFLFGKLL